MSFIIINRKRPRVWKEPFATRAEAESELTYQISMLPPETDHGWVIEERISSKEAERRRQPRPVGSPSMPYRDDLDDFVKDATKKF